MRNVEWELIEMPLPRLQTVNGRTGNLLYEIAWDTTVRQRDVAQYLRGNSNAFDNGIRLRPGVGEYLLRLNGLLRPLIQRQWAAMVARMNDLEESQLDAYLFGACRTQTVRVRRGLWEWVWASHVASTCGSETMPACGCVAVISQARTKQQ